MNHMRTTPSILIVTLLLAGCVGIFSESSFVDDDLDGIPDPLERELSETCVIAGRTCEELGVTPPTTGERDYILVQFSRSGPSQDWRLPENVWDEFRQQFDVADARVQTVELGLRDDIDVKISWEDSANEGRSWFTWLTYDGPSEDTAGWNDMNWINLHAEDDPEELLQTLLHEVYHSMLGDLSGNHSLCPDEEVGGIAHSNDPASILYVPQDCDTDDVTSITLGASEMAELTGEPFENLWTMNHPDWTP